MSVQVRNPGVFLGCFIIFLLSSQASFAQESCQTQVSRDGHLEVRDCDNNRVREILITTRDVQSVKTQLAVEFPKTSFIWKKVRVVQGDGRFSVDDQQRLRELAARQPLAATEARSILDVLANFLEPGSAVENFDADELQYRKQRRRNYMSETESNAFGEWTPICSLIGTMQTAKYGSIDDGATGPHQSVWPVGDFKTRCKGRCGWGCQQFLPQHRSNQYTMECFNHDVCHAETGQQLGPCADAFWAAAASYVFAPDCPALRR